MVSILVYDCHLFVAAFAVLGDLLMVLVGAMCPFWAVGVGDLWAVSKVKTSPRAPRSPKFILLESFSNILLVVSILGIVYDCHL